MMHWCIYRITQQIWFDARESVVIHFRALLRRVFNQGILPLLTKDHLGQSFDFQNQRQST